MQALEGHLGVSGWSMAVAGLYRRAANPYSSRHHLVAAWAQWRRHEHSGTDVQARPIRSRSQFGQLLRADAETTPKISRSAGMSHNVANVRQSRSTMAATVCRGVRSIWRAHATAFVTAAKPSITTSKFSQLEVIAGRCPLTHTLNVVLRSRSTFIRLPPLRASSDARSASARALRRSPAPTVLAPAT